MFGAMKILVPIGMGLVGLVAFSQKAKAEPGSAPPKPGSGPRAVPSPTAGGMTTEQVVTQMTSAIASADPKLILALADKLEKNGFASQAADLRGVAAALSKVGADAAGTTAPAMPSKPATPVAQIPSAPASSSQVSVPPAIVIPGVTLPTTVNLPEMTVTAGPSPADRAVASQVVINQAAKPKWQDDRTLAASFQSRESAAGRYKNILTGAPGVVDGLYGPGTAIDIAENFGIVPPSPKYWPKNPAPALAAYKSRLMTLAAQDPARASEWVQAATKAKVT